MLASLRDTPTAHIGDIADLMPETCEAAGLPFRDLPPVSVGRPYDGRDPRSRHERRRRRAPASPRTSGERAFRTDPRTSR